MSNCFHNDSVKIFYLVQNCEFFDWTSAVIVTSSILLKKIYENYKFLFMIICFNDFYEFLINKYMKCRGNGSDIIVIWTE